MYLAQIPFFPAPRVNYDITQLEPTATTLFTTYSEVLRCLGCGTCTKACPQEIDVRNYMAAGMRGDIAAMADISFDCIMCGLCAARCPAELLPPAPVSPIVCDRYRGKREFHAQGDDSCFCVP